ncbi:SMC-Scp complex subunit ScpB [Candidatus Parcubacteria bacterium]|nr:SMC-Scp complex subunit ScpB [Candidatus Parcubacteria bacterium]
MKNIKSQIESLLFVATKSIPVKRIAFLLKEKDIKSVRSLLIELSNQYKEEERGIRIIQNEDKFQMVSAEENLDIVKKIVKDEVVGELSRPSLETLTIVAYRGNISKIDLNRIRGVNCSLILRNLLLRGLIEAKIDVESDETFYNVTLDFLRFLGVSSVEELPDYEKLHNEKIIDRVLEDERVKEEV